MIQGIKQSGAGESTHENLVISWFSGYNAYSFFIGNAAIRKWIKMSLYLFYCWKAKSWYSTCAGNVFRRGKVLFYSSTGRETCLEININWHLGKTVALSPWLQLSRFHCLLVLILPCHVKRCSSSKYKDGFLTFASSCFTDINAKRWSWTEYTYFRCT